MRCNLFSAVAAKKTFAEEKFLVRRASSASTGHA
jgi:hypothetical protein